MPNQTKNQKANCQRRTFKQRYMMLTINSFNSFSTNFIKHWDTVFSFEFGLVEGNRRGVDLGQWTLLWHKDLRHGLGLGLGWGMWWGPGEIPGAERQWLLPVLFKHLCIHAFFNLSALPATSEGPALRCSALGFVYGIIIYSCHRQGWVTHRLFVWIS